LKFRLGETVVDKRTTLFVVIIGCQEQLNRLPIYQVLEPRSKNIFIRKEFDLMPQDPTGPTDPSGGVPLPKFTSREIAALKRLINENDDLIEIETIRYKLKSDRIVYRKLYPIIALNKRGQNKEFFAQR